LADVTIISLQVNTIHIHSARPQNAYPSNQLVFINKISQFLLFF